MNDKHEENFDFDSDLDHTDTSTDETVDASAFDLSPEKTGDEEKADQTLLDNDFAIDDEDLEVGSDDSSSTMSGKLKSLSVAGLKDKIKRGGWVYIAIGLVGLFVIYLIFSILFSGSSQPVKKSDMKNFNQGMHVVAPVQKHYSSFKPTTKKAEVVKPVQKDDGITLSKSDFKNLIKGFSGVVDQSAQKLNQTVSTIQSNMNQLAHVSGQSAQENRAQFEKLTLQIAKINTNLAKVSDNIANTQAELKVLIAEKAQNAQKLSLHAIVPGRAWLTDSNGKTISVSMGTELPYYGKVTKIDSNAGKVYMSSGYVFS